MFKTNVFARNIALAGAVTLLLASSAFAQSGYYGRGEYSADRDFANRVVEGTIASAEQTRFGEHIRLTSGMDLVVPNSVLATNQGRRYQTSLLQPGDMVRMSVFSREGDGRDARVRSFELLRSGNGYRNNGYNNDRSLSGTVVSFDRRDGVLVLQTDGGRTINVDLQSYDGRLHRGDRVNISGRMDRDRGTFVAAGVRVDNRQDRR
jgi:ribosomal protein S1